MERFLDFWQVECQSWATFKQCEQFVHHYPKVFKSKIVYIHRKPTGLIKEAGGCRGDYPGNVALSSILSVFGRFHNLKNWKYTYTKILTADVGSQGILTSFWEIVYISQAFLSEPEFILGSKEKTKETCFTNKATYTRSAQLVRTSHVRGLRSCAGIES